MKLYIACLEHTALYDSPRRDTASSRSNTSDTETIGGWFLYRWINQTSNQNKNAMLVLVEAAPSELISSKLSYLLINVMQLKMSKL